MLFPKRTKYRKMHRRDSYRKEYRVNTKIYNIYLARKRRVREKERRLNFLSSPILQLLLEWPGETADICSSVHLFMSAIFEKISLKNCEFWPKSNFMLGVSIFGIVATLF